LPGVAFHRANTEVAIIGGGIVGTAAAALLAERGGRVILIERDVVGAGASGRNLGVVQHPFDPILEPLYQETVAAYTEMSAASPAFPFPREPAGLLIVSPDRGALEADLTEFMRTPHLQATLLDPMAVHDLEPILAEDLWAIRLTTGHPMPPHAATAAMAERAVRAGARLLTGRSAVPAVRAGRAVGVDLDGGEHLAADIVLVAAGPWTPFLLDPSGRWRPIVATWGATAQLEMAVLPTHVLEEARVDSVNRPISGNGKAGAGDSEPASMFTLAAASGSAVIGSTFLASEPDRRHLAPLLVERGQRWLPALADARIVASRVCARPQSIDGRPLLGALDGVDGLFMAAGHGPWGISTGPATARLVVDAILNRSSSPIPSELVATRVPAPRLREVSA
jgi:glycine/D-amino acid oxidase-like deaminating enzyme